MMNYEVTLAIKGLLRRRSGRGIDAAVYRDTFSAGQSGSVRNRRIQGVVAVDLDRNRRRKADQTR